jgi:hypothetical protein
MCLKLNILTKLIVFVIACDFFNSLTGQTDFLSSLVYDSSKTYEVGDSVIPSVALAADIYTALKTVSGNKPPVSESGERINADYWATTSKYTEILSEEYKAEIIDDPFDIVVDVTQVANLGTPTEDTGDTGGTGDNSNDSSSSARLIGVSVRGTIGTGDDKRIMGFRLNGTADVLLRGVGPALVDYGLDPSKLLPDPQLTLFKYIDETDTSKGSVAVASGYNDNYTSNSNASYIDSVRLSLSLVIPANPLQAMSIPNLSAGFYTSQVEDISEQTGIGWAGVDLADASSTSSSFVHVSTRGIVQTTEFMFGAFEIKGAGKRTLYLRARGPSLSEFGVPGVMPDPILKVFKYDNEPGGTSTQVAENDDYGSNANANSILAFSTSLYGWPSLNDKDSGLILELEEGYYTIQLVSLSSTNDGVGWIGVDDVTGL